MEPGSLKPPRLGPKAICDRTEFKALSVVTGPLDDVQSAPAARILEHDVVFWLGDLNYRIRSDVEVEEVFRRWQTTAATRLATVARDAFLPSGEKEEREHVFAAVKFLLTSNL